MTSFAVPAPRAATGGPVGPAGWLRLLALAFWVLLPAVCVLGAVMSVATWISHADDQPAGIPGVFQVDNRSCGREGLCQLTGTFVSSDGGFVQPGVTGFSQWAPNSRHRVVFDTSTPDAIVPLPGTWNPSATITALIGAAGLLAVWGRFAFGARRTHVASPQLA